MAHGLVFIESNASNSATGGASASTNESATGGATSSVHSVVISCDWVEIRGKTSGDVRIYDFEEATTRLNSKNDAKLDKDKNRRDKSTDSIYELPVAPAPPNKGLSTAAPAKEEEGAAPASASASASASAHPKKEPGARPKEAPARPQSPPARAEDSGARQKDVGTKLKRRAPTPTKDLGERPPRPTASPPPLPPLNSPLDYAFGSPQKNAEEAPFAIANPSFQGEEVKLPIKEEKKRSKYHPKSLGNM